jgi:hypothetical protein
MSPAVYTKYVILLPLFILLALSPVLSSPFNSGALYIEIILLPYALFTWLVFLYIRYSNQEVMISIFYFGPLLFFVFYDLYMLGLLMMGVVSFQDMLGFYLLLTCIDMVGLMMSYTYVLLAENIYHMVFVGYRNSSLAA